MNLHRFPGAVASLLLPAAGALLLVAAAAPAFARQAPLRAAVADTAAPPLPQGRSVRLHRLHSGFLPADGLLAVGVAGESYSTTYGPAVDRRQVDFRTLSLQLEYGATNWLRLFGSLPHRSWSGGFGDLPPDASGLGDAEAALVWRLPSPWRSLGLSLLTGATLPVGGDADGLGEGEEAPRVVLAASRRFWAGAQLPELRLHLNLGRRWNRNEAGHGLAGGGVLEPWPPLYPAAPGDAGDNDFLLLGAAAEFRKGLTSLWIEYSEARLDDAAGVADREFERQLAAALRWGDDTGLALDFAVDVALGTEDLDNDFEAAYPDLVYRIGLSYAFPLGGRDRDGDGIKDRLDRCPDAPEDRDGFADGDGCPDWDNDEDGVPDATDRAPNLAEDIDGFMDEDGLPDLDNDGDGVPDTADPCPDEPEDLDGYQDDDGCPEEFLDADGDGIADADDHCPGDAEDFDGFEDGDGCPELDNDLDGIADAQDRCPGEAEDYDGVDDDDGCPE